MRPPDDEQRLLTHDREREEDSTQKQDAAVADPGHRDVREERAYQRSCGRARGDDPEEPLGLIAAEQFQEEAPEDRDREQVEDADEDPEKLAQAQAWSPATTEREADDRQRHRDARIHPRQEHASADACDEPAVNRD